MTLREISNKIYQTTEDRTRMEQMNQVYYDMADYIQKAKPDIYQEYLNRAEDILYSIPSNEALTIVNAMKPYGERWTMEDISNFIRNKGQTDDISYYLAMNMAYNDYFNTASKWGVDTPDFYYDIAYDFINDPDGHRHKLSKYFKK